MQVIPSRTQVHRQMRRRLLSVISIQAVIVGLMASYALTSCASLGGVSSSPTATPTTARIMPTVMATPTPQGPTWSDEFDGPNGALPDPSKWTPKLAQDGWGSGQMDYDTNNQNAYQDGQGNLVIEARREHPEGSACWYGPCQYTSGRITTSNHFSFTYGRIEARIKLPFGQGLWPTFWLLGDNCNAANSSTCGEIDIMENIGREPSTNYGVVHGPGYLHNPADFYGTYKLPQGALSDDFHVFALQWDPNYLSFFVDGINYYTLDRAKLASQAYWVYDHPFYIILNVAVGGTWGGNPNSTTSFPQKMYVSYVRIYTNK